MEIFDGRNLPEHEKLFDEICGKLQELSHRKQEIFREAALVPNTSEQFPAQRAAHFSERLDKMQTHLRQSQEELKSAQQEIHDKIRSLDTQNFANNDLSREVKRLSEQLDQERINNSKLSTDLAKSLEMNLRLQFEIEEIRSKANQHLTEEKKHNQFLQDRVKSLSHELDLSQALCNETRLELAKAKEKFQLENQAWANERRNLQSEIDDHAMNIEEKKTQIQAFRDDINSKIEELQSSAEALREYDTHTRQQHEMMKTLSDVAEKKMIELKLALDKRTIESQDYYSHLQQAMTQIHVLRQENGALKDYIAKLTALHQQRNNNEVRA
jgi:chromosome segregation ATPase